jgi:tripeptide aminopeptidase
MTTFSNDKGTPMTIDYERLASVFTTLCEIDSPSKKEGRVAAYLKSLFTEMGAEVFEDDSASKTGSDCGNLFVRFPEGGLDKDPVFFNCHMDTVLPAEGVKVKREGEVFSSIGDTVLGSDDKAGIAALIEAMSTLQEKIFPMVQWNTFLQPVKRLGCWESKHWIRPTSRQR